ncbi:IclR family transcriptional regulator [Halorubrum lipolyticum]|uniref:ArcR family transcription regulator n=1 Tax=Halorubrum lipolyticum DSM 21995 TaxID=1227482 RepID=M0NPW0_9EURY|nr:IclR family transcriptional regulator [Halorubrum lipolyticum]EMA59653.1 ArcR family transcription regulator [Halorubrum lipolyticum DSM 21995]
MLETTNGRTLKTTRTSLRILELILEHDGLTLAEIDRIVDKPKSSLHSHLNTLLDCRYVVKNGRTYSASFRLAVLGDRARRGDLEVVATDTVERLAEETGEEANFTVFEHGRLLLLHGSTNQAEHEGEGGFRTEYYLHNTAAGKAILAELGRDHVDRILDEWGMPREIEATVTDRDRLYDQLEEIAGKGYAIIDEEFAPGLVAVGAPVHADGEIVGGLSIGGPKYRINMTRLHEELAEQLLDAVEGMEDALRA